MNEPPTERSGDVPLLQVRDLSKSFFATRAVSSASFAVSQGEIVALLGENGAGPTRCHWETDAVL